MTWGKDWKMRYWHAAKSWSCWNSAGESFSFCWDDFSLVAVAILSQLWSSLFGHLRVFWPQPGSCHMLDFTQTGFGNSQMTLSQSPLKPDYPNQPSCLLKENIALESVFYKDTNYWTKKSTYFFSDWTWLVRQRGSQPYYHISLELSKSPQKNFEPWHRWAWQPEWRHWLSWSVEDIQRQEAH